MTSPPPKGRIVAPTNYRGNILLETLEPEALAPLRHKLAQERYRLDAGWPDFSVCYGVMAAFEGERVGDSTHFLIMGVEGECESTRIFGRREQRWRRGPGTLIFVPGRPGERWTSISTAETMEFQALIPDSLLRAAWESECDAPYERARLKETLAFNNARLAWIARAYTAALRSDQPLERTYEQALTMMLARQLIATQTDRPLLAPRRERLSPARLRAVLEYIEAHPRSAISIEDLAAVARLSSFHFGRAFRLSTGLPPHQHILRRRAERAHDLLRARSGLSLAEIADAAGFADQSHMGRILRRTFGVAPGQLRVR